MLADLKLEQLDDLYREVGLGNRVPLLIVRRLTEEESEATDDPSATEKRPVPLAITGTEGVVMKFAKCCRPIPGDDIVAAFSPGRGVVVHRQGCRNMGDFHKQGNRWLDVDWGVISNADFNTEIQVAVRNRRGSLATVATAISEMGSNIENVLMKEQDGRTSTLQFVITVNDRRHLANIMRHLRVLPAVLRINRMNG